MNNYKISIIVPVYKVEKYIRKCVDSIINQTYNNLEIFLVDDGSPDRCGEICEEYAQKDGRIKVIHKKNGGLSDARNVAIDVATGDYIMFVDSDDWIELNTCESIIHYFKKTDYDILCFGVRYVFESGKMDSFFKAPKSTEISPTDAIRCIINYDGGIGNYAWNKAYKKKLFREIRYPVGKVFEDSGTTYKLFHLAQRVYVLEDVLYNYLQREGSISENKFNPKGFMDRLDLWTDRLVFFQEHYPQYVNAQMALMLGEMQVALVKLRGDKEYANLKQYVFNFTNKYKPDLKILKDYNNKIKYYYYCRPLFNIYVKYFM